MVATGDVSDAGRSRSLPRDARLRLARRIDWRFTLDDPRLGHVRVGTGAGDDLVAALSAAVTDEGGRASLRALAADDARADTVILAGPSARHELAAAARAADDGGRLVVEIDGPVHRRGPGIDPRRTGAAVRIVRSLRAAGWTVRVWWAWPDRARPSGWAATDDPTAVRALLRRRFGPARSAAIARLAATTMGRWAIELAAPSLTVVAVRGGAGRSTPAVPQTVRGAAAHGRPGAVLLVTPTYRASAHVVALRIDPTSDVVRQVLKLARLPDDTGVDRERAALTMLAAVAGPDARWPHVEATDPEPVPWPLLVEGGLAGPPLAPGVVRADRGAAVRRIRALLEALPVAGAATRVVPVGDRLARALAIIDDLHDARLDGLARRSRPVLAGLAGAVLPVVFEHGDVAHPNLIDLPDGSLGAIDWERAEPDGLPLHDLTIALAYVAAAARGATASAEQAAAFIDALQGPDGWAGEHLDQEAQRLGVASEHRDALVVAAWVRSTAWLATAIGASPSEPDALAWLATDRAVALWDAALHIAESR